MNLIFELPLNESTFPEATDTARLKATIADVSPDRVQFKGQSAIAKGERLQWSLMLEGLTVAMAFHRDAADNPVKTLSAPQKVRQITFETDPVETLPVAASIQAVLLTGALTIPNPLAAQDLLGALVPLGCQLAALLFEPTGLHVVADLPTTFFPAAAFVPQALRDSRRVVLRVAQNTAMDYDTFDGKAKEEKPCWTFTNQAFPESPWTADLFLAAYFQSLSASGAMIDSISERRDSREPDRSVVRLAPVGNEVRWVARNLRHQATLACGAGFNRTPEVHFRPDVLIGAFDRTGKTTVPSQFQALPRAAEYRPSWNKTTTLNKADFQLSVEGKKLSVSLVDQRFVALQGPIRDTCEDDDNQEAVLALGDGWLSLRQPHLLRHHDRYVQPMQQLSGNLDPLAWSQACAPNGPRPPKMQLQLAAVDSTKADWTGTRIALTVPGDAKAAVLYLWSPRVLLTTPPLWRKQRSAPAPATDGAVDGAALGMEAADRLVPSLVPPPGTDLAAYDIKADFGSFVFVNEHVVEPLENPEPPRTLPPPAGLQVNFAVDFDKQIWQFDFESKFSEVWATLPGLPLVSNHALLDAPRPDTSFEDRRGLIPFEQQEPTISIRFAFMPAPECVLPLLQVPIKTWLDQPSSWRIAKRILGQTFFLPTLPGVEVPLAAGLTSLPKLGLRFANPALDESYARVTEDQEERRRDSRLLVDTTRVEAAVAFMVGGTEAIGLIPGTTVAVSAFDDKTRGISPALKFTLESNGKGQQEVTLSRPTTTDRFADLIHLGLSSEWVDDFQPPKVTITSFDKAVKQGSPTVVGAGQPLIIKPWKDKTPGLAMDGRGDLFAEAVASGPWKQVRDKKPVEKYVEVRTLGRADRGDALCLELCGVSKGALPKDLPRHFREERAQLHDGNFGEPRFRGFVVQPLALEEIEDHFVILVAALKSPVPGAVAAASFRIHFNRSTSANFDVVTILDGGIDWAFPPAGGHAFLTRVKADFVKGTNDAESFTLKLVAMSIATAVGPAEFQNGDVVLYPLRKDPKKWQMAVRGQDTASFLAAAPDKIDAPQLSHETGWILLPAEAETSPVEVPLLLTWKGESTKTTKTNWELRYGQSAEIRAPDLLKRFDFAKVKEELVPSKLKPVLPWAQELVKVLEQSKEPRRKAILRNRVVFLVDKILTLLNAWIHNPASDYEGISELAKADGVLQTWLDERAVPFKIRLGSIDLAWLARSLLEGVMSPKEPQNWMYRWHSLLNQEQVFTRGLIGDVVLMPLRLGTARCTFQITRDTAINLNERKSLSRHLQFDSLGGVLGAEVVRQKGRAFFANLAVQLQLILRDRQRRDALGIWKPEKAAFAIREDQVGEVHACAAFAAIEEIKHTDIVWATRDTNGLTAFVRWIPDTNTLSVLPTKFSQETDGLPRRVENFHPYLGRSLIVYDDTSRVTKLPLVNLTAPNDKPVAETDIQPADAHPITAMVTNYPFSGAKAAWNRQGQKGCWRFENNAAIKERFTGVTGEILAFWYGQNLLAATKTKIYIDRDGDAEVKFATPYTDIRGVVSLEKAPMIVASVEDGKAILDWYRKEPVKVNEEELAENPQRIDLGLRDVKQIIPLGPGRCAVLSGTRVMIVEVAGTKDADVTKTFLDPGSLVPEEIDLLDSSNTNVMPEGDLILRGPASRTLCTAILSYSCGKDPQLELSGKLVLQNDIRFFEKVNFLGKSVPADCTHRLDLFLDRASVPVGLLFGAPVEDIYLAGVGHHVFRFANGAERIWQVPQLFRFTSLKAIAPRLGLSVEELPKDRLGDLVIDASCVAWVQPFADAGRDDSLPPFDATSRGGAEIDSPLFRIRMQSKPRGGFNEAYALRIPFLASTAFEKLNYHPEEVPLPQSRLVPVPLIEIPSFEDPGTFDAGAQYGILSPRLVMPPETQNEMTAKGMAPNEIEAQGVDTQGIDFLSRTLQGRWLNSRFLKYCLSPEPIDQRLKIARTEQNTTPLGPLSTAMFWPGFDNGKLPKELKDLAALKHLAPKRGNRRFLAAATLARKVQDHRLTGPALVEFPFHMDFEGTDYDSINDAVDHPETDLPDLTPNEGVDLQLVVYESGGIRRLVRETVSAPASEPHLDVLPMEFRDWALRRRAQCAYRGEALIIRDFHMIYPVTAVADLDAEALPSALTTFTAAVTSKDARLMPVALGPIHARADLAPLVYRATPIANDEGKATPHSATHWFLARTDIKGISGRLPGAQKLADIKKPGGFSCHHHVPFEILSKNNYPVPLPDRVLPLVALPPLEPALAVQPPSWQLVAWSDRPGELMTSSFQVIAHEATAIAVSAEQAFTLRRARTATPVGATVHLLDSKVKPSLHRGWGDYAAAFALRDFDLIQTLQQNRIPKNDVRLFITDDQGVSISTGSAETSAGNPVILSKSSGGDGRPPKLFLVADPDWHPRVESSDDEKWTVRYLVRKCLKFGTTDDFPPLPTNSDPIVIRQTYVDDAKSAVLILKRENDGALTSSVQLDKLTEDITLALIRYQITDEAAGTFKLTRTAVAAISIAVVSAKSRIKPLKTSVAVLGYVTPANVQVSGYGQLGAKQFSSINPALTDDPDDGVIVDWQRTAGIRICERNPRLAWKYTIVVTGPDGETYPEIANPAEG